MDGLEDIELVECPECGHVHIIDEVGYVWSDCPWAKRQNYENDDGPEGLASDLALAEWYYTVGPGAHQEAE